MCSVGSILIEGEIIQKIKSPLLLDWAVWQSCITLGIDYTKVQITHVDNICSVLSFAYTAHILDTPGVVERMTWVLDRRYVCPLFWLWSLLRGKKRILRDYHDYAGFRGDPEKW